MAPKNAEGTGLLWINKDQRSESLSNSSGDATSRRQIDLHVQKWRTKVARPQRKAIPLLHHQVIGWQREGGKRDVLVRRPGLSSNQHVAASCICGKHICTCVVHKERAVIPYYPARNSTDPFARSKVPINFEIHNIIAYFTTVWSKTAFRSNVRPQSADSCGTADVLTNMVRECMSDELHMFSLLSAMTGRMKYVTAHKIERSDRPEQFHFQAIKLLRGSLRSGEPVPQQVIVDIFFLSTIEVYNNHWEGARAHLRMIKYLVEQMGGFDKLDSFVREMCWNSDMFVAIATVSRPIFEMTWDPGPLSPERQQIVKRHLMLTKQIPMGCGFGKSPALFDSILRPMVEDVMVIAQTAQYFWTCDEALLSDRDWVVKRSEALMLRLLSVCDLPKTHDGANKQDCCRTAIVIWLCYISVGMTGVPSLPLDVSTVRKIMPGNARHLRFSIQRTDVTLKQDWAPHQEILLWLLAVGMLVSLSYEDNTWFSLRLLLQANELGIHTYSQLSKVFAKYFWLDRLEQGSGWKLTEILEGKRQNNEMFTETYLSGKRSMTVHRQFKENGLAIVEISKNSARH